MAEFGAANDAYAAFFGRAGGCAPSRVAVQLALPAGARVMLDLAALRGSAEVLRRGGGGGGGGDGYRSVLHVQSRSAWAPQCLGPYAQANAVAGVAHLAGQIGLVPETMALDGGGFEPQLSRALLNAHRVAAGVGAAWGRPLVAVAYCASPEAARVTEAARRTDRALAGGIEDSGFARRGAGGPACAVGPGGGGDAGGAPPPAAVLAVRVAALPGGALVEVELAALTTRAAAAHGALAVAEEDAGARARERGSGAAWAALSHPRRQCLEPRGLSAHGPVCFHCAHW